MKKQYLKVVFKSYNQMQLMLLPPSLDDLIEVNHPEKVRETISKIETGLIAIAHNLKKWVA